jgi:glycosyltransferase involved in cell wall biosynthesis
MSVAIITPAYNAERYVDRTIEGVIAQTMTDWEMIVVNDGSTDRTAEIVGEYARRDRRIKLVHQSNAGMAAARNAGFAHCSGQTKYVIFLDADDVWRASCLATLSSALEGDPGAPAAHGRSSCIDEHETAIPHTGFESFGRRAIRMPGGLRLHASDIVSLADDEPTTFAALAFMNPITTPGQVLIRRAALDRVGLFDSTADVAADWDLWLRLAQLGPLAFVPEVVIKYRQHGNNASRQLSKMRRAELYVRHKLIAATAAEPTARGLARDGLRHFEMRRCGERLAVARHELTRLQWRTAAIEVARASRSLVECGRSLVG